MTFVFVLLIWIFSLCLHEFSHAAVAYLGGDHTVKDKGYLSFNPLAYADPWLSLGMPILFLLIGGLGLPGGCVYVERHLLKSKGWDAAVSLAGPTANLFLACLMAIPFQLGLIDAESASPLWAAYAFAIVIQLCAVAFNLIPIPPLDGFGAISAYMEPGARARAFHFGAQWGLLVIIVLFWFVPGVNQIFWISIFRVAEILGVPPVLAAEGAKAFSILNIL